MAVPNRRPVRASPGRGACRMYCSSEHQCRGPRRTAGPRPGRGPVGADRHARLRLRRVPAPLARNNAAGRDLSLARDLYQVAARVIEHGRADRLHLEWLKLEPEPQRAQSVVLGLDVVDGKRRIGMPSSTSACLKGLAAGWPSGSTSNSVPSGSSGETTVSQRASPTGTSVFFTNPRISDRNGVPCPGHPPGRSPG
jgi:hypothetical protein